MYDYNLRTADVNNDLTGLGIKAEITKKLICETYMEFTIYFNNTEDFNYYKLAGKYNNRRDIILKIEDLSDA